eukprot:3591691-Rhodomonas_salina.2
MGGKREHYFVGYFVGHGGWSTFCFVQDCFGGFDVSHAQSLKSSGQVMGVHGRGIQFVRPHHRLVKT